MYLNHIVMLRCSRCKIMFDEYYRMPDGRILCKECWRDELNLAEMKAVQGHQQRAQVLRDKDAFEQKRKADQVRLEQLEHAIKLEKGKCHSAWSSWDDGYRTDKPYNYEEVELLKRQHLDLSRQLNQNPWFKFPSTPPFSDNTAYYHRARFISKSQSHYFETVTLPAEQEAVRKAKEERLRAEQEAEKKRIAEEKERKKKEEDERKRKEEELRPLEDLIMSNYLSSNLSRYLSVEKRIKVAKETYREEVMLRCVLDLESSVVNALMYNPNITDKVRKAVSAKKEVEKKKLADEKARREAARLEEERRRASIKTTIYWIIGLAIAGGLIWLIVEFWEAILAILLIIFLLVLFLK